MQAWPPEGAGAGAGPARCAACRHRPSEPRHCAACPAYCATCRGRTARHRRTQLRALRAAAALTQRLEAELAAPDPPPGASADAPLRARLDDLVLAATAPLDFDLIRRALAAPPPPDPGPTASELRDPLLLLANYCTAQLFARHASERRAPGPYAVSPIDDTGGASESALEAVYGEGRGSIPSAVRARSPRPFYLELEVNGARFGRVVVALRWDAAPRMSRNFAALCSRAGGYRGCSVFQCWPDESVIAGDTELDSGRGGRSAFPEAQFAPDESRLAAVRGAVGMRRSQRRRDSLGLVGSQFRIVLRETRAFSAIFGFVLEGLELVERLSRTGDAAGKPHSTILISDCGELD